MKKKKLASPNLGTARWPIELGGGSSAYKKNGRWRFRNLETMRQFGRRFIAVTDQELVRELEIRGYKILHPAHECVDRPTLPCPACEMEARRALRIA